MSKKTDRFIIKPQLRETLPFHNLAAASILGPSYHCMNRDLLKESDIFVDVNRIDHVPADLKPFVESHTHPVSKVFLIIGDLTMKVNLDGEDHEVTGPASIFVPAGMKHTIIPLKGNGYSIVIMLGGEYKVDPLP